ncbi:hypothetical protein NMY22_g9076 [Coprinellus aureogranulatus]|nr:hypothetical protein NMY22_g9076 [Coprinellus aureogranulatus]
MSSSSRVPSEIPEGHGNGDQDDDLNGTLTFRISKKELLSLQIRALLDASDEVDLSADVAEDLLKSLPLENEAGDGSSSGSAHDDQLRENGGQGEHDEEVEGVEITATDGEISFMSVFKPDDADDSWTKQEVRSILHHLKERGSRSFISEYYVKRNIPIPKLLLAFGIQLSPELLNKSTPTLMYILEVAMSFHLRKREKLPQYNTPRDAKTLVKNARKILVLTGAGISVSCGIPDFRSRDGLYAKLKERGEYELDDPQQMFDINYFKENPSVFYSFASQIYPANFKPSPCHEYIKHLEETGRLLRNYTQNIDTLEYKAGIQRVIQCHGSFATASCLNCRRKVPGKEIEDDILNQKVPLCPVCNADAPATAPIKKASKRKKGEKEWEESESEDDHLPAPQYPPGIMKPDITFFGEKLDDSFEKALQEDRDQVDLLLVMGTSLKVAPVADILSHIPHSVPQILINKTPIKHINPDIILLGDADPIIRYLMQEDDWATQQSMTRREYDRLKQVYEPYETIGHVSLFEGAEGGKWLEEFKQKLQQAKVEAKTLGSRPNSRPNSRASSIPNSDHGATPTGGSSRRSSVPAGFEDVEARDKKRQRMV